jgi:hypothetical protein
LKVGGRKFSEKLVIPEEVKFDLYWFWQKAIFKNKKGETSLRAVMLFEKYLKKILIHMKEKGQSQSELKKNYKRIQDIIDKTSDTEKQISLARTQAVKIFDEHKCINRAIAAKELGHEHLFEVFFERAYQLGVVGTQEYREWKLQKLGII